MKYTFFLKEPKSDNETLILFSCYFKYEGRKFVYSTGEKVLAGNWDFQNKYLIHSGKFRSKNYATLDTQLSRYKTCFNKVLARHKMMGEQLNSKSLKNAFDLEFKKAPSGKNLFFDAFDEFVENKSRSRDWSESTLKRYKNIKKILLDFERSRKYKLTFNSINEKFHAEFTDFCMNERNHINNTYSRNMGLLKSFLYWALENEYTYNTSFVKFKKKKRVLTKQIALKLEDLESLMGQSFESARLEKVRDVFVFCCLTGLRFGELKLVNKYNVANNAIQLKEEKETTKTTRSIPLSDLARFILTKYDYRLPLIANQKFNNYIKEVFKLSGFTNQVEKVTTKGQENIRETMPFYDRVSSHTARRTFITMMRNQGHSDKLIASMSGHKDLKTLNMYYQVDDKSKEQAIENTFQIEYAPLKKVK